MLTGPLRQLANSSWKLDEAQLDHTFGIRARESEAFLNALLHFSKKAALQDALPFLNHAWDVRAQTAKGRRLKDLNKRQWSASDVQRAMELFDQGNGVATGLPTPPTDLPPKPRGLMETSRTSRTLENRKRRHDPQSNTQSASEDDYSRSTERKRLFSTDARPDRPPTPKYSRHNQLPTPENSSDSQSSDPLEPYICRQPRKSSHEMEQQSVIDGELAREHNNLVDLTLSGNEIPTLQKSDAELTSVEGPKNVAKRTEASGTAHCLPHTSHLSSTAQCTGGDESQCYDMSVSHNESNNVQDASATFKTWRAEIEPLLQQHRSERNRLEVLWAECETERDKAVAELGVVEQDLEEQKSRYDQWNEAVDHAARSIEENKKHAKESIPEIALFYEAQSIRVVDHRESLMKLCHDVEESIRLEKVSLVGLRCTIRNAETRLAQIKAEMFPWTKFTWKECNESGLQ